MTDKKLVRFRDYFAGRNVLLTGGTGFVGMALTEGLLSASEKIGRIYVIVREKRGLSPAERVTKLLTNEIFNHVPAEAKAKVIPLVGDLTAPNFGLREDILVEIRHKVSVFYHNAGLIKFNRSVKEAIDMNLLTTQRAIDLAKTFSNLSAFIYSSTALVNSNIQDKITEEVYKTKKSPKEMIKMSQQQTSILDKEADIKSDLIEGHQNSYTYAKQLAENLIAEEMVGMPAGITRPSLVYGFYDHEMPGWMGNSQSGHCGHIRVFVKGAGRCLFGHPNNVLFAIPCDYVVKATLALTVDVGTRPPNPSASPEIIHVSNNRDINPITVQKTATLLNEEAWKNPCDSYAFLPRCKIRNGLRADIFLFAAWIVALMFYIPERILNLTPPWMRALHLLDLQVKARKYFTEISSSVMDLDLTKALQLTARLHPDDVDKYSFHPADIDWRRMFAGSIMWLRKYYYKDSGAVTWMHRVVQRCFLLLEFSCYSAVFIASLVFFYLVAQSWIIGSIVGLILVIFFVWV
ncbi:hypothetical protein DMENIID0001_162820 [Sergentomyia squamirostris]